MFKAYPETGGWIFTYTQKKFYPMQPKIEDIDILDIAHALSHICRYAGHCKYYYSVGQHSILLAEHVKAKGFSKEAQLAALLHDSSEAYLVDIPKPVKHCFNGYAEAEDRIMDLVSKKYNINPKLFTEIKPFDTSILLDEIKCLFDAEPSVWEIPAEPLGLDIKPWSADYSKARFLEMFTLLSK